jgi:glycogen synthase
LEWMERNASAYTDGAATLSEVARRFRPDLLHSNQFCFGKLPIDIPKLITAHSDVLSWAEACRPNGLERSRWLDDYGHLVQCGLDGCDCVVAPTRWMSEALRRNFSVCCAVEVVNNGRRINGTTRQHDRSLRAVSVGRLWDEAKGSAILKEIQSPIPVVVAGEGKFKGSKVRGCGQLSEEEVFGLFRSSSIYIATSIYEPFGLAPVEAALCGCAILARDIPSLREVWGPSAMYFDSPLSLEALLCHLTDDSAALFAAQSRGMQRARQFTAERMGERYLSLYGHLLERAGSAIPTIAQELAPHAA